ncbi:MAG: class I SAM-dependent RNA methyltransferase [Bacteroidales bacterium]|nr:class I SAM-dependent RNA methyltransferase [Bacteroidales bacterium]
MLKYTFVATTLFGLEKILAREIELKGGEEVSIFQRAVSFRGGLALLYKMNYSLRTAIRVLWKVKYIRLKKEQDLYDGVYSIPWEDYFTSDKTIAVNSVVNTPLFNNSLFVSLRVKDAIVDRFRDKTGVRPDVDIENPMIVINVHIHQGNVDISLDASGTPLFKRGYKLMGSVAPLNEVLAAGMIMLTGWDGESDFIDPMCGSGTLSIEAAMIAKNIPPGVFRKSFAFQNWNNYDEELFLKIVENEMVDKEFNHRILASDISPDAIEGATNNIKNAQLDDIIEIKKADFFKTEGDAGNGILIINPPYGERLSVSGINEFYKEIGDHLKKSYQGYTAWVLSSNMEGLKYFGLKPGQKLDLLNGQIKCKYLNFELFKGKRNDFLRSNSEN